MLVSHHAFSLSYGDIQTEKYRAELGLDFHNLEDYLHFLKLLLDKWVRAGVVGIKIGAYENRPPDRGAAKCSFQRLMAGETLVVNGWHIPVIFCTPGVNLRDNPPFTSLHRLGLIPDELQAGSCLGTGYTEKKCF